MHHNNTAGFNGPSLGRLNSCWLAAWLGLCNEVVVGCMAIGISDVLPYKALGVLARDNWWPLDEFSPV